MTLAVLVGLAGAGAAYDIATPEVADEAAAVSGPGQVERRVRWKPCVDPAVLVGKACVTDVTRTVALSSQSPPSLTAVRGAQAPLPPAPSTPATGAPVSTDDHGGARDDDRDDDRFDDDRFDDDRFDDDRFDDDHEVDSSGHGGDDDHDDPDDD